MNINEPQDQTSALLTLLLLDVPLYTGRLTTASDCVVEYCEEFIPLANGIQAPNIITPNGDHFNDFLVFPNLGFFPTHRLDVWNRWGNLVYSRENYGNDWHGDDLPGGTYYYNLYVGLPGEQSWYLIIHRD